MNSALHAADAARQAAQWQRNKPSLYTDLALGAVFLVVAKLYGLTAAALSGGLLGLLLFVVQRFVRVDLLGGLAMFGVVMGLLSAAFSWWFQDEELVKLKGVILGGLTASLFLSDGLLNRGRYFGPRLGRYLMHAVDARRLCLGMAILGAFMALLNFGVGRWFSTDVWLAYNAVGDLLVAMLGFMAVMHFARLR